MVIIFFNGDTAYTILEHFLSPYRGAYITLDQVIIQKLMSKVRVSEEWEFGGVATYWASYNFYKNQKLHFQLDGKQYAMATILTNLLTCFYGSKIFTVFKAQSPAPQNAHSFHPLVHKENEIFVEVDLDEE